MSKIERPGHIIRRITLELQLFNEGPVQVDIEEFLEDVLEQYRLKREALTALLEG